MVNTLKYLYIYAVTSLTLIVGNSYAQSFTVSSKHFKPISSGINAFNWFKEADSLATDSYYLNDQSLKVNLKNAISTELETIGIHQSAKPGILVGFRVTSTPARLNDFNKFTSKHPSPYQHDGALLTCYNVDPGTVLITFYDARTEKIVWQGFASGLLNSQASRQNIQMINEAVRLILQEFSFEQLEVVAE